MTEYQKDLAEELRGHARRHDEAASRASSLSTEDDRLRAAAQLRFVAVLATTDTFYTDLADAWISASSRMLEAYDRADLDEVHASRSSRRTGTDA